MSNKVRIDQILVDRGLAPSRTRAQALIMAGVVLVGEQRVEKPSERFDPSRASVRVKGQDHPYVGRGGLKLAGALDHFKIDPKGKICLDVGASTGGFTDCLLQRGAKKVYAFDSGTNQLDYRLRQNPQVIAQENFNVRHIKSENLPEKIDFIVLDVSFISVTKLIPALLEACPGPWQGLFLIKPQFEAGPEYVERGGLVSDLEVHQQILAKMEEFFESLGLEDHGTQPACITGAQGNQEYFKHVSRKGLK